MALDEQSWQVVNTAQRCIKGDLLAMQEFDKFDISALQKADYQLGNRDISYGWRKLIQDQINKKKNNPEILELKPGAYGIKLDVKALIKRVSNWLQN